MDFTELENTLERLRRRAAEGRSALRIDPGEFTEDSYGFTALQHHLAVVTLEQTDALLRQAHVAARVARGERVTCADCGAAIPQARLAAMPFATRCVPCQSDAERVSPCRC